MGGVSVAEGTVYPFRGIFKELTRRADERDAQRKARTDMQQSLGIPLSREDAELNYGKMGAQLGGMNIPERKREIRGKDLESEEKIKRKTEAQYREPRQIAQWEHLWGVYQAAFPGASNTEIADKVKNAGKDPGLQDLLRANTESIMEQRETNALLAQGREGRLNQGAKTAEEKAIIDKALKKKNLVDAFEEKWEGKTVPEGAIIEFNKTMAKLGYFYAVPEGTGIADTVRKMVREGKEKVFGKELTPVTTELKKKQDYQDKMVDDSTGKEYGSNDLGKTWYDIETGKQTGF